MRVTLLNLSPNQQYGVQFKLVGNEQESDWSPVTRFTTSSDILAPAKVTGLSVTKSGTAFAATWNKVTKNTDGSDLKDFKDYVVTVSAGNQEHLWYVTGERFDLPFEYNLNAFTTAQPIISISVAARDLSLNVVPNPPIGTAANDAPPAATNFKAESTVNGINFTWDASNITDLKYYRIYSGATAGSQTLKVYEGPANNFTLSTLEYSTTRYYRLAVVDVFNQEASSPPVSKSPLGIGNADLTPPANPTWKADWYTSNTDFDNNYNPVADVVLKWNANSESDLYSYKVRFRNVDKAEWQTVNVYGTPPDTNVVITNLLPGKQYRFQLAAADKTGNISEFIESPGGVTTIKDTTPPPAPSKPIMSNVMGQTLATYDGLSGTGATMPNDLQSIQVHASTINNFATSGSTLKATIINSGGQNQEVINGLTYGTTYYFKFVAKDFGGNLSPASIQTMHIPARLSGLEIEDGSLSVNQINFASQLGGGRAWFGTEFPTVGHREGDTFFDQDDGNHPYYFTGSSWVDLRDANIVGATNTANQALTAANGKNRVIHSTGDPGVTPNTAGDVWFKKNASNIIIGQWEGMGGTSWLPKTLDNAVIANLDAGKITAGFIDAARLNANSISADKLTVSALSGNLAINGNFTDINSSNLPVSWNLLTSSGFAGATYSSASAAADVAVGTRSLRLNSAANNGASAVSSSMLAGTAGERIALQAYLKGAAAYTGNSISLTVYPFTNTGGPLTPIDAYLGPVTGAFVQYSGVVTLPVNAVQFSVGINIISNASARSLYASGFQVNRVIGGTLIANGAITTEKVQAGAITANLVGTNQIITASANIGTGVIDDANIANLNAGKITAGSMQSSLNVTYDGTTRPSWKIDLAGNAQLNNTNILGQIVVGTAGNTNAQNGGIAIKSYDYISNVAGWAIKGDGTVEFSNGVFRGAITGATITGSTITGGTLRTATTGGRVNIDSTGIKLYNPSNVNTVNLDTSTGMALITGNIKTALSGRRVEVGTNGNLSQVDFWSSGTSRTYVRSFTESGGSLEAIQIGVGDPTTAGLDNRININTDSWYTSRFAKTDIVYGVNFRIFSAGNSFGNQVLSLDAAKNATWNTGNTYMDNAGYYWIQANDFRYSVTPAVNARVDMVFGHDGHLTVDYGNAYYGGSLRMLQSIAYTNSPRLGLFTQAGYGGAIKFAGGASFQEFEFKYYDDNGYIACRASTFIPMSDESSKEDIGDFEGSFLDEIRGTKVRNYRRKKNDKDSTHTSPKEIGLIAQEAPSQITTGENGNMGVDLYQMCSLVWGAVREQDDIIKSLAQQIKDIEKLVKSIKEKK